jgi:putative ABC transport system ATP-binding protein
MIELISVSKAYDKGLVQAVREVSFAIPEGSFYSLTGPSGCGKSTLLNLIGLLDAPDSGEIRLNGQSLQKISNKAAYRNREVGFIFQLHHLVPVLTLRENVELPMVPLKAITAKERRERALKGLEEMGLSHRAAFLPGNVSGGERQRAAVARALVNRPRLLLADEPTGSVDSVSAEFIMEAIARRSAEDRLTTLLVTHDTALAQRAERILRMLDGQLQVSE